MSLERVALVHDDVLRRAALLMAMLGVYGVVSYSVQQRTVEIGTRMALGATSRGILAAGRRRRAADGGVTASSPAAWPASPRPLSLRNVFELGALGPAPFLYSTGIVATVALMATTLPACRAALLSPMVAIRNQPESMWRAARVKMREAVRDLSAGEDSTSGSDRSSPSSPARFATPRPFRKRCRWRWRRCGNGPAGPRSCCSKNPGLTNTGTGSGRSRRTASVEPAQALPESDGAHERRLRDLAALGEAVPAGTHRRARAARESGTRMAVPLRTKNEIVGVLLLGAPEGRESFTAAGEAGVEQLRGDLRPDDRERAAERSRAGAGKAAAGSGAGGRSAEAAPAAEPLRPAPSATLAAFTLPARTVGGDYYDFLVAAG